MLCNLPYINITITPLDVMAIAAGVKTLAPDFDPVTWLEQNKKYVVIVATEAAKDIVYEALEIGLADHPLVLQNYMTDNDDCDG